MMEMYLFFPMTALALGEEDVFPCQLDTFASRKVTLSDSTRDAVILDSYFLQRDASLSLLPSLSLRWPRPQNRRKASTVCSQARAVY